jgi:anti-sigma factor RsiW
VAAVATDMTGQACAEWYGELGAYLIGALDANESAAMKRHLAGCLECHEAYEDLLPVRDWLIRGRRHLAGCRECRDGYEDLLHLSHTMHSEGPQPLALPGRRHIRRVRRAGLGPQSQN